MYCRSACVVLVSAAIDNVGKDAGGDGGASQGRPSLVRVHRYGMRWAFACCLQRRVRWQERCDVGPIGGLVGVLVVVEAGGPVARAGGGKKKKGRPPARLDQAVG